MNIEARKARRLQLFDAQIGLFPPGRLVDLGTGHGRFAIRAADAGWDTTAVDARDERFPDDDRVKWVTQDAREFSLDGFDLILCLGLFYHLTADDQIDLLSRASGTPIVIDTHVATAKPTHALGPPVSVRGYRGRMYREPNLATSSWNNRMSFWPRRADFYRMLADHGYPVVLAGAPWVTRDRTFFLCLPDGRD